MNKPVAIRMIYAFYRRFEHLSKYLMIGCVGVSLDFSLYYMMVTQMEIYYQYASVISISAGIITNFILNTFLNFKVKNQILLRFASFFSIGTLGIIITAILLNLFVGKFGIDKIAAKIIIIFIVTAFQFTMNKFITFRKRHV